MEDLITKFIDKNLTKSEAVVLKKWLDEDEEHVRFFKNYVNHHDLSRVEVDLSKYKVWKKLNINQEPSLKIIDPVRRKRNYMAIAYKIAAILILALGIGFTIHSLVDSQPQQSAISAPKIITKQALRGQKLTLKLPDGTLVKLNAGSSVTYSGDFQGSSRDVSLKGEAFFDVVRDESRPFNIDFDGLEVEVLGTSFNINTNRSSEAIVSVLSGKVAVTDLSSGSQTVLEKNQRVRVNKENRSMNEELIGQDDMDFDWTDNYLSFDNLGMNVALKTVTNWFDVDIKIESGVTSDSFFRAKFKNPTLEEVMESLAFAYGFQYKIENKKVEIMK